MSATTLEAQVKSLEAQLAVLKAQLAAARTEEPSQSFAGLYGLLSGKVSSSEQDIEAAKFRFDWEASREG